jgi:hypothetical protein
MTISEIIQRIRLEANDDGTTKIREDAYYINLIISAVGDLESFMGKLSIREDSFQFLPMRDADKEIIYQTDGITPEIDTELFYNPDEVDTNSPSHILVNKGLRVATGQSSGTIQTADFLDPFDMMLPESDIAFIKIDAEVSATSPDTVALDISFDDRETWLHADYSITIAFANGTTGYIDVSKIPSTYVALKWILTGPTALVRNTTLERLYIPKDKLRHYGSDIVELAKLRLLEVKIDKAISNQNDPMVIQGMQYQALAIRTKYGLNKNAGDTKPMSGGAAINYYPASREESAIMGFQNNTSPAFLMDGRIVGISNDGTLRRVN